MTAAAAQSAFRTCGLMPFNRHAVDAHLTDLKPQQVAKGPTALAVAEATLAAASFGPAGQGQAGRGRGQAGRGRGKAGRAGGQRSRRQRGWGGEQRRQQRGAPAPAPQHCQHQLRRRALRAFARPFTAWRGRRRSLRHW